MWKSRSTAIRWRRRVAVHAPMCVVLWPWAILGIVRYCRHPRVSGGSRPLFGASPPHPAWTLGATFRRSMDYRMTFLSSILRNPAMRLYLLGQLLILVG